jgi:hypothetical protein
MSVAAALDTAGPYWPPYQVWRVHWSRSVHNRRQEHSNSKASNHTPASQVRKHICWWVSGVEVVTYRGHDYLVINPHTKIFSKWVFSFHRPPDACLGLPQNIPVLKGRPSCPSIRAQCPEPSPGPHNVHPTSSTFSYVCKKKKSLNTAGLE